MATSRMPCLMIRSIQEQSARMPDAVGSEIIIPGSFLVLQGNAGDGMNNTLDSCPVIDSSFDDYYEDYQDAQNVIRVAEEEETMHRTPPLAASSPRPLGQLAHSTPMGGLSGLTLQQPTSPSPSNISQDTGYSSRSSYTMVTDSEQQQQEQAYLSPQRRSRTGRRRRRQRGSNSRNDDYIGTAVNAIAEWTLECRAREQQQRKEWKDSIEETSSIEYLEHPMMRNAFNCSENNEWWHSDGRLAIFGDVPTRLRTNGKIVGSVIGTLSPGSTVMALDIIYLKSTTLRPFTVSPTQSSAGTSSHNIYPHGRMGWIQMIKLEFNGLVGYTVLSLDGYPLMAPGLPSLYIDPSVWIWRVTCPAGAFVRDGLDLNTQHTDTLPFGSLIQVSRRTLNGQGLSRLLVHAGTVGNDDQQQNRQGRRPRWVDGWCSEFLNPLSGQRGTVVQPLPFPVPALYRVTLSAGAVIRSDIELSSPQVGLANMGAVVKVVGRAFSEHPTEKCIERLKLAGNGGWISVRLNRPPPRDDLVVEFVGMDSAFDPNNPGAYHLQALRRVHRASSSLVSLEPRSSDGSSSSDAAELSSVDESSEDGDQSMTPTTHYLCSPTSANSKMSSSNNPDNPGSEAAKCLICLTEERNATIVHGETGHVACCLVCARILKARGDKCPVCRLEIDIVIQQFWA